MHWNQWTGSDTFVEHNFTLFLHLYHSPVCVHNSVSLCIVSLVSVLNSEILPMHFWLQWLPPALLPIMLLEEVLRHYRSIVLAWQGLRYPLVALRKLSYHLLRVRHLQAVMARRKESGAPWVLERDALLQAVTMTGRGAGIWAFSLFPRIFQGNYHSVLSCPYQSFQLFQ